VNILSLCHEYPPVGGGAAAICAALAQQAVAQGHRVHVVTMQFGELPEREQRDGYLVHRVACGRRRKFMATPWECLMWAQRAWPRIERLHREQPFDVSHAHFLMPAGIVAARAKRLLGIPYLATSHGSDVAGYNRERLKIAHLLARPWWLRIVRQADSLVCSSYGQRELLHKSAPDAESDVIPNGIDIDRFAPGEKQRRILLCSRLVERKGFQYFLKAVERSAAPGWEIDLVGDGPLYNRLAEMGLRCRMPVHLHGWIDNEDPRLHQMYRRAMIYAFPSERENFPIALLEGMSAGCAIIATDTTGNRDAVGDAGILVPPRDVAALRTAAETLTTDADHCRRLGQLAQQRVKDHFTWEAIGRRYLDSLEACLAGGHSLAAPN